MTTFRPLRGALFLLPLLLLSLASAVFADAPILVEETAGIARVAEPVTLGVPFARSRLAATTPVRIVDPQGTPVDAQFAVMSRWDDGSIRWLKCDFTADVEANATASYRLETDRSHTAQTELAVNETAGTIQVTTGPLRFEVSRTRFALLDRVWLDLDGNRSYTPDEEIVSAGAGDIAVEAGGRVYSSSNQAPEEIAVEESGPTKVVIRVSGRHVDDTGAFLLKYETRIYAYAGQPFVELTHVYANGRSVESLGDSMDPSRGATVDRVRLDLRLNLDGPKTVRFGGDQGVATTFPLGAGETASVHQLDRATTATPLRYEIRAGGSLQASGERAEGWGSIADGRWGALISSRYFWQKYPKAMELADDGTISFQPVPTEEFLWAGMGTADRILIHFHDAGAAADARKLAMSRSKNPLQPRTSPRQFRRSGAFYALRASGAGRFPGLEAFVEETTANHLRNREALQLYGNFNFGDTPSDEYATAADPDEHGWGNNYYDAVLTAARLFAESGDPRQLEVMVPMAWHFLETDCWNTYDPGDWLNGFCAPYGAFHRAIGHIDQHYGEGIWYYYYLTGDERAKEVGLRAARSIRDQQWWANQNPNCRNAYQRGTACLEAYKATGDPAFLDHARHLLVDKIAGTQDRFGMLGAEVEEGGLRVEGEQTFMMALYSDSLWKFIQELPPQSPERITLGEQIARLADFFDTYARKAPGAEDYWNWWSAPPSDDAAPTPFPAGGNPDASVYWNGRCLITGTYAYAYHLTGEERYRTLASTSMDGLWGRGQEFGQEFWGKESCQALKNLIHAAAILDPSPTPVLLVDFDVQVLDSQLQVAWAVPLDGAVPQFRLALRARGQERALGITSLGAGRFMARESLGDLGSDLEVALYAREASTGWQLLGLRKVDAPPLPSTAGLTSVHPNPFNPRGVIQFSLDRPQAVRIAIVDLRGRQVTTLGSGVYPAGRHELIWEGTDMHGRAVASGLYFAHLSTEAVRDVRKLTLLR